MPPTTTLIKCLALIALAVTGCRNQQGVATNPFVAAAPAETVPPPATRIATPAANQPYYQGAVASPAPGAYAAAPLDAPAAQPTAPVASSNAAMSASPAGAIGLPTDNQPLRFANAAAPAGAPGSTPTAQPASYAATGVYASPPPTFAVSNTPQEPAIQSPEFSPLPPQPTLAWAGGAPVASPIQPPTTQVTQATYQSTFPSAPRVRLPGYATPVSYTAPPATPAGPVGRVQVTELPPPTPYEFPQAPLNAADGFQPRGATPRSTPTPDMPSVF